MATDCKSCLGFGFWPGETVPMTHAEAMEWGYDSDMCVECGEDNYFYSNRDTEEEEKQDSVSNNKDKFTSTIRGFELRIRKKELEMLCSRPSQ